MRTLKLSLVLGSTLLIMICLLLFSTHPDNQVYMLEGQVKAKGISPVSLDVYVTQESEFPASFNELHRTQTLEDGSFKTEFYGEINAPIYFYVMRDELKPVRKVLYPKAKNGEHQKLAAPVLFEPVPNGLSLRDYGEAGSILPFYAHKCAAEAIRNIPVRQIKFFEDLNERYCPHRHVSSVEGDVHTDEGAISKAVFREAVAQQVTDKLQQPGESDETH
ncbi:MAG: hypothetical protein GVY26_08365 [Bacteroidetes bacterium]|jgi:hypothetical protein|nr:hypothetical protein [Bacteroidota bacterium]